MRQNRVPADVRLETQRRTTARGMRNPVIDFRGKGMTPMNLHLTGIQQVLPGDTLKSYSVQARIIGQPTSADDASVTGSWFEHYLFNVRVGDLPTFAEAMRNVIANISSSGAPTWDQLLVDIVKAAANPYFYDEDEAGWSGSGGIILRWPGNDWMESATPVSQLGGSDTITDDWDDQWVKYQSMRRAKLTTNTFEEWLAKQGVAVPPQLRNETDPAFKKPELLHFQREFAYPQPTANPSGTNLAHAVQWFIQDRMTRARFFSEPGWLVSFMAVRPKAILKGANSLPADPNVLSVDDLGWFPPEFDTDPHTALTNLPSGVIVADGADTVAYPEVLVGDRRDYLLNGYQKAQGAVTMYPRYLDRRPTQTQIDSMSKFTVDWHARYNIASRVHKDVTF